VDRKNVNDPDALFDAADSIGLSSTEAASVLKNALFKEAVDLDWMRSMEVDPEYVPSVLLDGELLANPQEYNLYQRLMSRHGVKRR